MENKEAPSPQEPEKSKRPGPISLRAWLGASRAKTVRDPATSDSLPPRPPEERETPSSAFASLYQKIDKTHPGKFSVPFAEGICSDLDCAIDNLLSQGKANEILSFLRDLNTARNEVVLTIDYLDPERVHPLYRLVLRNRAILRLKDVLQRVLKIQESV